MPDASAGKELQIVIAQPTDLARYLALMEEVADGLRNAADGSKIAGKQSGLHWVECAKYTICYAKI